MKSFFLITLISCSSVIYGQSKKDIILQQSQTIDSLNIQSDKLSKLNIQISAELAEKNKEITKMEGSISAKEEFISTSTKEITKLKDVILLKDQEISTLDKRLWQVFFDLQVEMYAERIYFEGTVVYEYMWEGGFSIDVDITKGKLAGKSETLFFWCNWCNGSADIDDTGNTGFDGSGEGEGKKIKGYIILSKGVQETDYESGEYEDIDLFLIREVNYM